MAAPSRTPDKSPPHHARTAANPAQSRPTAMAAPKPPCRRRSATNGPRMKDTGDPTRLMISHTVSAEEAPPPPSVLFYSTLAARGGGTEPHDRGDGHGRGKRHQQGERES